MLESVCPSCSSSEYYLKCDNCGKVQEDNNAVFCSNCGADFKEESNECPKCGAKMTGRICDMCGHDIAMATSLGAVAASVASKVSCKVVGHNFLGCKCTRCGETRDQGHDFRPVQGKCEQKCRVCGKIDEGEHTWVPVNGKCEQKCKICGETETIPHTYDGDRCTRCGKTKFNPVKFYKENKVISIIAIVLLVLLLLFGAAASLPGPNEALTPSSASEFKSLSYQDAIMQLQEAGFANIETEPLGDLIVGFLHDEGDVSEISINGKTDFSSGAKYDKNAKIIIRYHSYPQSSNTQQSSDVSDNTTSSDATSSDKQNDSLAQQSSAESSASLGNDTSSPSAQQVVKSSEADEILTMFS
ncbi:MAG: zinc ribbon domain-containing protein [Coriobacteriales bacterium]|jgi:hypothetical protein|nr:zinc ribbon domain-containing protein [Coriobacteriales bacterium]